MPSETREAYVWIWLPGAEQPVVAGKLTADGAAVVFNYGRSYLALPNRIPIYLPELPLQTGIIPLPAGLFVPGCIRDAAPDAWGRRVILHKRFGAGGATRDSVDLDELTYLLESGSDRIGALDFQASATHYIARTASGATLDELLQAAVLVERGELLPVDLRLALYHGSAIGGARPKALIENAQTKFVAKFLSTSDVYSVVKAEFVAMRLAALVGLCVAPVSLERAVERDVLLIERFDRTRDDRGWQRHGMVSALTLLGLDELLARYASYEDLAEIIRHRFENPAATLKELFGRLCFNILVGNTDDHARNHAAFWDGEHLTLTPAYDICPQGRAGNMATQGMLIHGDDNRSQVGTCLAAASIFLLSRSEALAIVAAQIEGIVQHWPEVCDAAALAHTDRQLFANRHFLNPYAFENLPDDARPLERMMRAFKR